MVVLVHELILAVAELLESRIKVQRRVLLLMGGLLIGGLMVALAFTNLKRTGYVDIYGCRFKQVTTLFGVPLGEKVPDWFEEDRPGNEVRYFGYRPYADWTRSHWVSMDDSSYHPSLLTGLSGLVIYSQINGYSPLGRPATSGAKVALVDRVLSLWRDHGVNAAGTYLLTAFGIFWADPSNAQKQLNRPVEAIELPTIQDFLKSEVPSDEWTHLWDEG
ncbi:MAG: hypothetical protein M3R04_02880 [bacterium]|nr:hypothetical protein [bacterium]